mgnify:CR=1 FL=1
MSRFVHKEPEELVQRGGIVSDKMTYEERVTFAEQLGISHESAELFVGAQDANQLGERDDGFIAAMTFFYGAIQQSKEFNQPFDKMEWTRSFFSDNEDLEFVRQVALTAKKLKMEELHDAMMEFSTGAFYRTQHKPRPGITIRPSGIDPSKLQELYAVDRARPAEPFGGETQFTVHQLPE